MVSYKGVPYKKKTLVKAWKCKLNSYVLYLFLGTPCFDKWIDPVTGVCTCDEGMFGDNCQGISKLSILYVADKYFWK